MKVPADLYARSPRVYRGLEELTYPFHDQAVMVTRCGRICFHGRKVNLSHVFAGQSVGVTQVGERIWLVTFMQYDLGYFDDETCRLEPIENPFGPKLLPIRSERPGGNGSPGWTRTRRLSKSSICRSQLVSGSIWGKSGHQHSQRLFSEWFTDIGRCHSGLQYP